MSGVIVSMKKELDVGNKMPGIYAPLSGNRFLLFNLLPERGAFLCIEDEHATTYTKSD